MITEVSHTRLSSNEAALWWLGQHSFVLKFGDCLIYLDPFLSPLELRHIPPLITAEQTINADLITGSHDHGDHIDRPIWAAIAQASADALFLVAELLRDGLSEDQHTPSSRFCGLDDGESIACRGIVGNMTYQEAADLAGAIGAVQVVPAHYDMFEGNLADVEAFRDYLVVKHPQVHPIIPGYGERILIRK